MVATVLAMKEHFSLKRAFARGRKFACLRIFPVNEWVLDKKAVFR
jgi:hypothetical protein